jgi:hypothetical protein
MARHGAGKFSLKQLWNFILTKTNIINIDQIEQNTSLQPGARIIYHGTGDNSDGTADSGFLYYLSGSSNWVKPEYTNLGDSGDGKLLGVSLSPTAGGGVSAITGPPMNPVEEGMLLRGQVVMLVWGSSAVGPFVGSPVWGLQNSVLAGQLTYKASTTSGEVNKIVGTVLKIVKYYPPLFVDVLLDFSPDHSRTIVP